MTLLTSFLAYQDAKTPFQKLISLSQIKTGQHAIQAHKHLLFMAQNASKFTQSFSYMFFNVMEFNNYSLDII